MCVAAEPKMAEPLEKEQREPREALLPGITASAWDSGLQELQLPVGRALLGLSDLQSGNGTQHNNVSYEHPSPF